ncbi:hypothetical protein SLNWT_5484 [Streptomyces albus]|uniref:Uncharacterized protein n=1 Tax=Streptomyces albus (strain ATCC 21838 / DSM 41398 / FERM P-419 / JCM 4703 / NBRC 107858) TaxID=1081613 RepID=A0A0B5F2R7_STRA4|nr:hypothetical protein SLNWT_5484 [Streptomyces albus]AOU80163.1 hypothetical protein SLNHY_5472 [Streptomyces albus]AYN35879.1 hypothetical protein DUI70_5384 [Streptomyces albus]
MGAAAASEIMPSRYVLGAAAPRDGGSIRSGGRAVPHP